MCRLYSGASSAGGLSRGVRRTARRGSEPCSGRCCDLNAEMNGRPLRKTTETPGRPGAPFAPAGYWAPPPNASGW